MTASYRVVVVHDFTFIGSSLPKNTVLRFNYKKKSKGCRMFACKSYLEFKQNLISSSLTCGNTGSLFSKIQRATEPLRL